MRVGLEDNLWLDRERQHPATKEALVARLARLALASKRPFATPPEARRLIGLEALA